MDTYSEYESDATAEELTNVDLCETEESKGKRLWELFRTVVLLTEQMRQASDTEYHEILKRSHRGEMTDSDYLKLMKRMAAKIDFSPGCPKIITQSNALRHQLNLTGVLGIAGRTKEPVYLFIAKHKNHDCVTRAKLMSIGDLSSNLPGPGIFAYTKGMPVTINSNLYTLLGIVNGTEG